MNRFIAGLIVGLLLGIYISNFFQDMKFQVAPGFVGWVQVSPPKHEVIREGDRVELKSSQKSKVFGIGIRSPIIEK
ncbi:MAG: hypothetical protein A3J76_03390 [Candidatus Moranbacteria bacterium RBG_13_45_13]|nr:MAG: hypothetical protein A3J76_03390 [Candidatus Moranbacteria bacterium RBG_13_45_13]